MVVVGRSDPILGNSGFYRGLIKHKASGASDPKAGCPAQRLLSLDSLADLLADPVAGGLGVGIVHGCLRLVRLGLGLVC